MNTHNITLAQLNLTDPNLNASNPEMARTILRSQLTIAGGSFHVTAIQVNVSDDGVLTAVDSQYDDEIEALYVLSGDSLTTVTVDDKPYVLAICPHAA